TSSSSPASSTPSDGASNAYVEGDTWATSDSGCDPTKWSIANRSVITQHSPEGVSRRSTSRTPPGTEPAPPDATPASPGAGRPPLATANISSIPHARGRHSRTAGRNARVGRPSICRINPRSRSRTSAGVPDTTNPPLESAPYPSASDPLPLEGGECEEGRSLAGPPHLQTHNPTH